MPVAEVVCHVCRAPSVEPFRMFSRLRRAASDCRPWPAGGSLVICRACGTVQKSVDQTWRDEAAAIYADYDIYHQAIGRAEQAVFDQRSGAPTPRSRRILESLTRFGVFARGGRMLDIGCGSGAMLRAFSDIGDGWELHGQDPNIKLHDALLKIPKVKTIHSGPLQGIAGTFDFISIIHALEHIEDPVPVLKAVQDKLSPRGLLLIQVPYFADNPFDLVIADHCTHFTVATLLRVVAASGFTAASVRTDVVPKEITLVAQSAGSESTKPFDQSGSISASRSLVGNALAWLQQVLVEADAVAKSANFGVFGTSIAANWLYGELGHRIKFFVDEDPNRIGTTYRGRAVHHPNEAPVDSDIYMALPRLLAEQILARLKPTKARFHAGPEYERRFSETRLIVA